MNCKKCGHKTITEHGFTRCLSCGTEVVSGAARRRFINANLPEILKDTQELGINGTHKKWRLSVSTIWRLRRQNKQESPGPAISPDPGRNGLPPLPAFDNSWPNEVQVKWLEVWASCRKLT